ncbi:MAG: hypothetical protein DRP23_06460 [Thermotogae bacterium]|nr:MAG: hypothetical protein DRP23_06460 [Thermotogota bacterium]
MERKKKSERDKYREIFAQIFKTSSEQDEIEELSKPANRVDQNLDYSQVVDAIILSPFIPMTKIWSIPILIPWPY